ncbi:3-methyladenine DNA glycosylase AlkD [Capnocytophaga haemolytica]|uniref:DNA alkylation repair enzyme n=1 Tax=Capnocytophaga haemolytica TaxID=45243 RepID=A0AAX2GWF0_9FLAO|nr:DNA alkylation repair protein [Capnocytophaga haemolytica]AMD85482.1 DNA alkylation repair protein [Capnocytophaga haemolytica]SFO29506.1 3-methyladenine DNA glycosylase AlkD [Capnocytophaga haemolytica]SNV01126.1 DNA alkylation repair enzyme [Capnocytophaga haemolytica]
MNSQLITNKLLALRDETNKAFVEKLIPTVPKECILGVRTPQLRTLAKDLWKNQPLVSDFLAKLPHYYLEENHLHGFLIEKSNDYSWVMTQTERFLPFIDNWATCDSFSPKIFKKYPTEVYVKIKQWLDSPHTYTVRYGIGLLLSNYLDEAFEKAMLHQVAGIHSEDYYVNMMIAWYLATALAKQPTATLPLIKAQTLPKFVQNKAIQKARESRRISEEMKTALLGYKL